MDSRARDAFASAFDLLERGPRLLLETRGIDAFKDRQVTHEFADGLSKLPARTHRVSPAVMVAADSHVDQRLQEEAARPALGRPFLLPYFVAFEEPAGVEQADPVLE